MPKITIIGNGAVGSHQAIMMAMVDGNDVTLAGRPASSTLLEPIRENDGFSIRSIEIDDIMGINPLSGMFSKAIPEDGLTRQEFTERLNLLSPIKERADILLKDSSRYPELENISENQSVSKETLLSVMEDATHVAAYKGGKKENGHPVSPDGKSIRLTGNLDKLPEQDYAIVAVKGDALNEELATRINAMKGNPKVIVAANGIMPWVRTEEGFGGKSPEAIADVRKFVDTVGAGRTIGMVLQYATSIEEKEGIKKPGIIHINSKAFNLVRTAIGHATDTNVTNDLKEIENLYTCSGISCTAETGGVAKPIIRKLGVNMANSPCAIFDMPFDDALNNQAAHAVIREAILELYDVAESHGIKVAKDRDTFADNTIEALGNYGHHRPSTLMDVSEGKDTEKDYIVKAVIEMGEQTYIETPALEKIYKLLTLVEEQSKQDHRTNREGLTELRGKIKAASEFTGTEIEDFLNADFSDLELCKGAAIKQSKTKTTRHR